MPKVNMRALVKLYWIEIKCYMALCSVILLRKFANDVIILWSSFSISQLNLSLVESEPKFWQLLPISSSHAFLYWEYFGQTNRKCISSSISLLLHCLQILSSRLIFWCLPFSMAREWLLILSLVSVIRLLGFWTTLRVSVGGGIRQSPFQCEAVAR